MERRNAGTIVKQPRSFNWITGTVRIPVPAMAALFLFALMIPAWFSFRAGMHSGTEQQILASGFANLSALALQNSQNQSAAEAALVTTGFTQGEQSPRFTVVDYARQFTTDEAAFENAEIVIIRLPNLTRFSGEEQHLFTDEELVPVALYEQ